jgi:NitT/TauT family transport system permease protein
MTDTVTQHSARPQAPPRPRRRWTAALLEFVRVDIRATVVGLVVGAVVWQLVALALDKNWLPTFTTIAGRIGDLLADSAFRSELLHSVGNMLLGFALAVVVGLAVGLAMGLNTLARYAFNIYVDVLLFIPPVVVTPVFFAIFGLSNSSVLAIIFIFSAPIIAATTKSALMTVDHGLIDAAASFGASRRQSAFLVVFRAALPMIFTGLHLGIGRAVKGMIIGQLILAVVGIGAYEARFQQAFDSVGLWSIAVIVVIVAIVFSWVVHFVDRLVNSWAYVGGESK